MLISVRMISAYSKEDLAAQIRVAEERGWTAYTNPFAALEDGEQVYKQPMMRYNTPRAK